MSNDNTPEIWFLTGSQHLYGAETLRQVDANSAQVVSALNDSGVVPVRIVFRPVLTGPDEIADACREASASKNVIGVILWMHTFSPAKMWIRGLQLLQKPFLHLHTQFNDVLPWSEIDMDFMNLNQAAHGDREAGHIHTRMRLNRRIVVGHWAQERVQNEIAGWARSALGRHDLQGARFVRFGDNMRFVAVTDGDKVAAESKFGFSVNTHGIGDLVAAIAEIGDQEVDGLVEEYGDLYDIAEGLGRWGDRHQSLRDGARIELGLRAFLTSGNFKGFTTTFEDLHGMRQLPGLAVQRLMADGYGFAGEGDWKTAAMLRAMKTMAAGLPGGTAFMEDYTYHLDANDPLVLGSHMLEVDPSISAERPRLECHPLGIGGKSDPVRLVFNASAGPAINVSLVDLGNRFRLILNEVDVIDVPHALPKLPVARAVWRAKPDFVTSATAWLLAGGAHHTVLSYALGTQQIIDFAEMVGVELVVIDDETRVEPFKANLRAGEVYYHIAPGLASI
ncbi:L-arabinose isomerase [Devosia sp. Leaf420]|uniref:L-arabinose isomerase n=1 Tax=Devosia sp. Leaf420 TaxID=1736374 RepID=UPI00071243E1|nr:L-arabinose isomerase [Devosia sp. Leaf420]KQT48134.1 L-arabinose isomerase [Devosia sp. Leaf420]